MAGKKRKPRSRPKRRRAAARRKLTAEMMSEMPDSELLAVRLCDLPVQIEGSPLEEKIDRIYRELSARGIKFKPRFWLSDEWFSPEGYPGVAIPFYLAHPRLARLELSQMLEVEGGTDEWCMRILRHEVGHAIDHGFRLQRNRRRIKIFGRSSVTYPEFYAPRPYSRSFVQHLDSWYAQSHPDEDFAETFAVWLTPDVDWRARYEGWPAFKKIAFMDQLMSSLAGKTAPNRSAARLDPLHRLKKTLAEHYAQKRARYTTKTPSFFDRDLRRLFSEDAQHAENKTAVQFIRRIRREVRKTVGRWTGEYQYRIDRVLHDILERCDELKLRLAVPEDRAKTDFAVLLTVQTMNYLHSGRHRIAL